MFKALPASTSTRDQTTSESSTFVQNALTNFNLNQDTNLVGERKDTKAKVDEDARFTDKRHCSHGLLHRYLRRNEDRYLRRYEDKARSHKVPV